MAAPVIPSAERRDYYVYALFREAGTPFYIGKGTGKRLSSTKNIRGCNNAWKANIIADMRGRGLDIPTVMLVEGLSQPEAHALEIVLIAAIGRAPHGPLVNMTAGGDGSQDPGPETRAKLRAANLGKKQPPDAVERTAAANRGRKRSDEARAKMRAAAVGRKNRPASTAKTAAALRGRKRLPETIAKIVATRLRNHGKAARKSRSTMTKEAATAARSRGLRESERHRKAVVAMHERNRGTRRTLEQRAKMVEAWKKRKESIKAVPLRLEVQSQCQE